jgi:hypothetical protein
MKLFFVFLTGFLVLSYAFMWYLGTMVPAWHVLIWVTLAFINELDEYFKIKLKI